jgi:hypothetical protein
MSAAIKAVWQRHEYRAKQKAAHQSPEYRAKMSAVMTAAHRE